MSYDNVENYLKMVQYNKQYNLPLTDNSQTNFRKSEYRSEEHDKLKSINRTINIIYYSCIILLFMLLFTDNNLYFKERFIFYIFLIFLPYLYPWIFMYTIKLKNVIMPTITYTGPKNAFIDINKGEYLYNI
jgi:hypothetical protein